jgi:hypothetical protein
MDTDAAYLDSAELEAEGVAPSVAARLTLAEQHRLLEASRIPDDKLDFDNVIGYGQWEVPTRHRRRPKDAPTSGAIGDTDRRVE